VGGSSKFPSLRRRGAALAAGWFSHLQEPPPEIHPNDLDHLFGLFKYPLILKPHHLDPEMLQEKFSIVIVFASQVVKMNLAIEFNSETLRWTIEIQDIVADTVLPPNFLPSNLEFLTRFQNAASAGVRFFLSVVRNVLKVGRLFI
jgi:hypothetical protein